MKKLGTVGLVLMGFYFLSQGIQNLTALSYFAWPDESMTPLQYLLASLPAIVAVTVGVFLIAKRSVLADYLFDDTAPEIAVDATDVLRIGFTLLGAWFALVAMPQLIQTFTDTSLWSSLAGPDGMALSSVWSMIFGSLTYLVMGVLLVIYAGPLARRLAHVRIEDSPVPSLPACPNCGTAYEPQDYDDSAVALCARCHQPLPDQQSHELAT